MTTKRALNMNFPTVNLALAICMAALVPGAIKAQVTLAKNGQIASIVAPAANSNAAMELVYHIGQMAGSMPSVVANAAEVGQGPAIFLGEAAEKAGCIPQKKSISAEGYRLKTDGNKVLIAGESPNAVLFGAYRLLEELGCDWVMPGTIGEIIPEAKTIVLPAMDISSAPDFMSRRLWYRGYPAPRLPVEGANFAQWLQRMKAGSWRNPVAGAGGHVWDQFIRKHQKEFDADPTMLALRRAPDGSLKRMGPQLESTHPRVIQLFIDDIKAAYKKNIEAGTWNKDSVAAFGIGPADGLDYSISAESLAAGSGRLDPVVGEWDRTDELILMGNKILAEVHKEYPNVYVGFYSYSTHADYPMRYKPDPKIVIIFAPINFSRFHSVLDKNSKTQHYYKGVVEQWGRLFREQGNVLVYRGYNWNLADNILPYSKARIWGEELPFYKTNGVIDLNIEATKAWSVNGLSDYVMMRLAWDTSLDWHKLVQRYCEKSFGAGGPAMQRYFERLIETQHAAGQEAGSYHAFHLIYNQEWIKKSEKDIAEATSAAKTDNDKTRISFVQHNVTMLKLYLDFRKASANFDFQAAKAGYDAMESHWKKGYEINTELVANEGPEYLQRFMKGFVDEGLKYSSGTYKIIYPLPDAMPTMLDPGETGPMMNFYEQSINDSGFILTRTYSSTWDAQGLCGMRSGAVWYRTRFSVPAKSADQPIGLFIGGVEDEARVWINGRQVGSSGQAFSMPSTFDLTDGISYKGENVLAIQVVRNSKANEIGLGGILQPSFVFAGPRVEEKAASAMEFRRVLPGGELGSVEK